MVIPRLTQHPTGFSIAAQELAALDAASFFFSIQRDHMAKAGDYYRELVGSVMSVLDPGSAVKTEQWIEGPDGERDMDVEVRGLLDGNAHFVLVECKDHRRPIGIGYVDAFESKIRDLKPNRAILFSNSGFTAAALKKAKRVNIEMASALKSGDAAIRIRVHQKMIARRLTLTFERSNIYPFPQYPLQFAGEWSLKDMMFSGRPGINWMNRKMKEIALERLESGAFTYTCTLRDEAGWTYQGTPLKVAAISFRFTCVVDWVAQPTEPQVSLGYFDHQKKCVVIPSRQLYTPGIIDREAWEQSDQGWEEGPMSPNSIRLRLTLIASNVQGADADEVPAIETIVAEEKVDFEPPG